MEFEERRLAAKDQGASEWADTFITPSEADWASPLTDPNDAPLTQSDAKRWEEMQKARNSMVDKESFPPQIESTESE